MNLLQSTRYCLFLALTSIFCTQKTLKIEVFFFLFLTFDHRILDGLTKIHSQLEKALKEVFYDHTVEEWLKVFIEPKIRKISDAVEKAKLQLSNS